MTTLVRITHLDSHFPVEVIVMSPSATGTNTVSSSHQLPFKGDEHAVYLHSGQYIEVREVPSKS